MQFIVLTVTLFFICIRFNQSFIIRPNLSTKFSSQTWNSKSEPDKDIDSVKKYEKSVVSEGLTHVKYNKYAPTPEEASTMTDEEFRATIYKRMKEAERERRKSGPIGGASSDDYINSLSRKNNE